MEELIVRGWLFTGLRAKLNAWPTILADYIDKSVVLALLHGSLLALWPRCHWGWPPVICASAPEA
jgi:membrane protease YdiL (CAAX protease family)